MAQGRRADANDGKFFGAIGYRIDGRDPPFVKITPGHFDWKDVKLLRDITDDSAFGQWFAATGNHLKFVDASSELIAATASSFPKLPMVPAKIGMKLV